jgi:hypothetical protein
MQFIAFRRKLYVRIHSNYDCLIFGLVGAKFLAVRTSCTIEKQCNVFVSQGGFILVSDFEDIIAADQNVQTDSRLRSCLKCLNRKKFRPSQLN